MKNDLPHIEGKRLKPEYEELYLDWMDLSGCRCHILPPCSYCMHEGNPLALEETPEAWEDDVEEVVKSSFDASSPKTWF